MPTSCRRLSGPDRTQLSIPMIETSPSPPATGCACTAKKHLHCVCRAKARHQTSRRRHLARLLRALGSRTKGYGPSTTPSVQGCHPCLRTGIDRLPVGHPGPDPSRPRIDAESVGPSRPMLVSIAFGAIGRRCGSNGNSRYNACFLTIGYMNPANGRPGAGRSPCGRNWPLLNSAVALFRAFDCLSGDGPFLIFRHPAVSRLFRDA
jgi:hypothetical protein